MQTIDLRSDTVTQPSDAMRRVMALAEVGDDAYGEDPTARKLEELAAQVLGKQAALFVPSGTMANTLAIMGHCQPGDEILAGQHAHSALYESGAAAALAGAQLTLIGRGGLFTAADLAPFLRKPTDYAPHTRLVMLENTHNRAGGRIFPQAEVGRIAQAARDASLALHLDGARLWNAAVATGCAESELASPFDTVSACFSKGLGAPIGSVLAGTTAFVSRARRHRKMLGGGLHQIGQLCAAALYALEHNRSRLVEDHQLARSLAEHLGALPGLSCDPTSVDTNIVLLELGGGSADDYAAKALVAGVSLNAVGPRSLRLVTHLGVDGPTVDEAIRRLATAWG